MKQRARSLAPVLILLVALPAIALASPAALPGQAQSPNAAPPVEAAAQSGTATLDGYVRDANTDEGLLGYVYLYDANDPGVEYDAYADATGYYSMTVPLSGTYDIYGTMVGYTRVDGMVTLTPGQTNHQDFDLPAPRMAWKPAAIRTAIDPGEVRDVALSIRNSGSDTLIYRLEEASSGSPEAAPAALATPAPTGVDPQVYANLAASPDGTAEILVVMAEQADLSTASSTADWHTRGRLVYETLKKTADRTQARTRSYLDSQGIAYASHLSLNSLTLQATRDTVTALTKLSEVGAIRPGHVYDAPRPPFQSAAAPKGVGWNIEKVSADSVWQEIGVTGAGIVVANIDTGVEWDHDALRNQYRGWNGAQADHNYNWWDPRGACELAGFPAREPCDNYWHGTHVMGTIVGSDLPGTPLDAPNGIGMAPGARWIACKGCEMVDDWLCSTFALLECADFVLAPWDQNGQNADPDLRPHIVNNSWGGAANDGWYSQVVAAWRAAGIFPAFSAGNKGPDCSSVTSPGDYPGSFTTGATDHGDSISWSSSRGPSWLGLSKPDVVAPGVNVRSSVPDNSYVQASGTSMASPHSAGEAALLWSVQPALVGQVATTERLIRESADAFMNGQCGDPGPPNVVYGWGRIDARQAVSMALTSDWDVGWLAASPEAGTVLPGRATDVRVLLDSAGLSSGSCYTATLWIETNDPYEGPRVQIPVDLCVGGERSYLPIVLKGNWVPSH